jgi:hypothetical protein
LTEILNGIGEEFKSVKFQISYKDIRMTRKDLKPAQTCVNGRIGDFWG